MYGKRKNGVFFADSLGFEVSFLVVVVLRSPIHANEPSEYNGMLYRTSNRVLNNGIKVIILICMDGTSQYHHHQLFGNFSAGTYVTSSQLVTYKLQ